MICQVMIGGILKMVTFVNNAFVKKYYYVMGIDVFLLEHILSRLTAKSVVIYYPIAYQE